MPNKYLHGNGYHCPACKLRRDNQPLGFAIRRQAGNTEITCNHCDGTGRIARDPADIVADAVAEAARFHWQKSGQVEI